MLSALEQLGHCAQPRCGIPEEGAEPRVPSGELRNFDHDATRVQHLCADEAIRSSCEAVAGDGGSRLLLLCEGGAPQVR